MGRRSSVKRARREQHLSPVRRKNQSNIARINFAPVKGLASFQHPSLTFGPNETLYAFLMLGFLGSGEQYEEVSQRETGQSLRLECSVSVVLDGKACGHIAYHPLDLFFNIGETRFFTAFNREVLVHFPSSRQVIRLLEKIRLDAFVLIRALSGGAKSTKAALQDPLIIQQLTLGQLFGLDQGLYVNSLDPTHGELSKTDSIVCLSRMIVLTNLLLGWCRERYNSQCPDHESWLRGRTVENSLLLTRLDPPETWHKVIKQALAKIEVNTETLGKLVSAHLPSISGAGNGTTNHVAQSKELEQTGTPRRWDPERLLFYMNLDEYLEPRALETGDRFGYIAVQCRDDKIVLDTAHVGNRLFGLQGPLEGCLKLAHLSKREIRENPLCKLPLIHDPEGKWHGTVRQWLRGDDDQK